ncbi:MAG TPA: hypothetical protein VL490_11360 [Mucilaginibacter sp.]|nr:hypothetical protein [Mucilaginibacter sp.]
MNEQTGNTAHDFLEKLLANPADNTHAYDSDLQSLVTAYPQSGVLRALLLHNGQKESLKHAAAYYNPLTLFKLATAPDSLPVVTNEQVIYSDARLNEVNQTYFTPPAFSEPFDFPALETIGHDEIITPADDQETSYTFAQPQTEDVLIEDADDEDVTYNTFAESEAFTEYDNITNSYPTEEPAVDKADDTFVGQENYSPEQDHVTDEISEVPPLMTELGTSEKEELILETDTDGEEKPYHKEYEAYQAKTEIKTAEPVEPAEDKVEYFHQDIDDEIYDEIVSIEDIGLEQIAILNKTNTTAEQENKDDKSSYFVFEPAIEQNTTATDTTEVIPQNASANNNVSRYNDEKMPYSFMWWLDKTRKKHAGTYQPYVSTVKPAAATQPKKNDVADELQQQYYENIVSLTSIDDLDKTAENVAATPPVTKEEKIIERFIKEEPQIQHPSGIKLDNENKAKQSSEDRDELVTETLARIYTEQMLYNKAILTYKKLMLKFPEKSLYFAGQIEQLENKIN